MLFIIVTTVVLVAVVGRADCAQLISSFHLDLDDCDDIAADSNYLYFACHSAHAPGLAPANPANTDAWVAKLERRTGKLLYLTQLGGEGTDVALRVKIDRRGDAYVTGLTGSRNFPVTPNAVQRSYGGGPSDAFFAEIGSAGQILYCTYLGGPDGDEGNGIAFSRDGSVFIGGRTWSADFPGAKRRFGKGGKSDLFVARLKSGEPAIRGALILGGAGEEKEAAGIGAHLFDKLF